MKLTTMTKYVKILYVSLLIVSIFLVINCIQSSSPSTPVQISQEEIENPFSKKRNLLIRILRNKRNLSIRKARGDICYRIPCIREQRKGSNCEFNNIQTRKSKY